ncbi:nose resistant to fluoxetine protein 6 [Trichonephila clavata]|uniref:Nose resistant to fluoxetine protein 6 n=1 Tax=Trichonephila clavata TaxID=2740835 RepID=A0A8X6F5V0_TRICU|nr:nose resistant to fluoxetine protein 6 [Trichonephila clavata]
MDMQFHLMTPLFMVSLFKWPRFGYGLIILGICVSCCYRCILTIKYSLLHHFSCLRYYVDGNIDSYIYRFFIHLDTLHIKPIPNLSVYLLGLGWGHYIWNREINKKRSNSMMTLCFGWIGFYISLWIFNDVLYFSEESLLKHIAYNGFGAILFSCCMGWVFHVCTMKPIKLLSRLLSLKIFFPFSRLSFAAYLINFMVIMHYLLSSTKQDATFSLTSMIGLVLHVTFWTYIMSLIASLLVEVPVSRVFRWLQDK